MKLHYLSLLIVLFLGQTTIAQIINIPDPVFKDVLVNGHCADLDGDGSLDGDVDTNDDGEIQQSEAEAVFELVLQDNAITSMEGLQSFTNIEILWAGYNKMTELDVSQNTALTFLECAYNQFTELDVSNNVNLITLNFYGNQLSQIDVTANVLLEHLTCGNNEITSLDVSQNPLLESLDCGRNLLTELDVTNNPLLVYFICTENELSSLDVSQNTNLDFLVCYGNLIESIDVSQNLVLRHFNIYDNLLTSLDLSVNSNLQKLSAQENNLTYLNIQNGNNTNMVRMYAQDNPNLECILVDEVAFAESQECIFPTDSWCKDEGAAYLLECVLSVDDVNLDDAVVLYPNPTQNLIFIDVQQANTLEHIEVFNLQGQSLLELDRPTDRIDLSALPAGVYLCAIETDRGNTVKKIHKQ